MAGHVLGYDQETGFGLVQALGRLDLPALPLGNSAAAEVGEQVVVGGAGGRQASVAARIVAKQEFAGYWEYVLDEAIFTAPAHPNWGGTALIGPAGDLIGIGSLQIQQMVANRQAEDAQHDRADRSPEADLRRPHHASAAPTVRPRPWLGLYATEIGDSVAVLGLASRGPAQQADLRTGDIIISVGGEPVKGLAERLPAHLVARPGRRDGAAGDQPRRQDDGGQRALGRPPPLPQGPGPALKRRVAGQDFDGTARGVSAETGRGGLMISGVCGPWSACANCPATSQYTMPPTKPIVRKATSA